MSRRPPSKLDIHFHLALLRRGWNIGHWDIGCTTEQEAIRLEARVEYELLSDPLLACKRAGLTVQIFRTKPISPERLFQLTFDLDKNIIRELPVDYGPSAPPSSNDTIP